MPTLLSPTDAIERACARIAPSWPLDRLIAVNPYWGWVDRPITDAAAQLAALAGAQFTMPRAWYRARLADGTLEEADIARALEVMPGKWSLPRVLEALALDAPTPDVHPLITDLRDTLQDFRHTATWHDLALRSIGRACESWFDRGEASWSPDRSAGLFGLWRALARADAAPRLQRDLRDFAGAVDELPTDADTLIAQALDALSVPPSAQEAYLTALLLSMPGWASACAHVRWEARLAGHDDRTIVDLLAIRLAWELILFRTAQGTDLATRWLRARRAWQETAPLVAKDQAVDWVLQRAVELRYHDRLARALALVPTPVFLRSGPAALATTRAQAVFCIDVRSEVVRRHLEREAPGVRTLGFAGFFGLPIAYAPVAGAERPQLPGLLAPTLIVEDLGAEVAPARRAARAVAHDAAAVGSLAHRMPAAFSFVEATGLASALGLLEGDLARTRRGEDPLRAGLDRIGTASIPFVSRRRDGSPLDGDDRGGLAAGILRAMSLTHGFARLVAFIGHGAAVTNNPQAAGLACGACGGQSGEVNARALAALLNDSDVRTRLLAHGIVIPDATRFTGATHDTVTDRITLMPEPAVRATHADDLARLQADFDAAAERTRHERAAALGGAGTAAQDLMAAAERAADWSEIRPEWGLARNAAFIVAPRDRTRPLDLAGRAFLHEYRWQEDPDHATLEAILTAPAIVAHWINFQYYASTVDPVRAGSGDKTLHNVVGGGIGLYEGSGGDLRVGLAMQSVHDGTRFVHEPLRLALYVEAPAPAIDRILAEHAVIGDLVRHEWIHLYRIAPDDSGVYARRPDGWELTFARASARMR